MLQDKDSVQAFNRRTKNPKFKLRLDYLPEPFQGNPHAPVVLLNLNPGFRSTSPRPDKYFRNIVFANLQQQPISRSKSQKDFRFYHLNIRFWQKKVPGAGGHEYWFPLLRSLIAETGYHRVANRLLCVEFFPYPSEKFDRNLPNLKSQEYGFNLVRRAMKRKAVIIITRGWNHWEFAVPELKNYSKLERLKNHRRPWITENNLPNTYKTIIKKLRAYMT